MAIQEVYSIHRILRVNSQHLQHGKKNLGYVDIKINNVSHPTVDIYNDKSGNKTYQAMFSYASIFVCLFVFVF